jgi:hypothetical protein
MSLSGDASSEKDRALKVLLEAALKISMSRTGNDRRPPFLSVDLGENYCSSSSGKN